MSWEVNFEFNRRLSALISVQTQARAPARQAILHKTPQPIEDNKEHKTRDVRLTINFLDTRECHDSLECWHSRPPQPVVRRRRPNRAQNISRAAHTPHTSYLTAQIKLNEHNTTEESEFPSFTKFNFLSWHDINLPWRPPIFSVSIPNGHTE